jgi:hypothetical protein
MRNVCAIRHIFTNGDHERQDERRHPLHCLPLLSLLSVFARWHACKVYMAHLLSVFGTWCDEKGPGTLPYSAIRPRSTA